MSFKIEQGLFNAEFTDHHAILGISIDSDAKDIRKRYLKIARRLHPDSSNLKSDADRQLANELLSKLVNPAYEYLSQEKNYTEYCILLKLKGQQAQRQPETVILSTDSARQLASAPNVEQSYQSALNTLSDQLYTALNTAPQIIGQISELNLVYLMRKAGSGVGVGAMNSTSVNTTTTATATAAQAPPTVRKAASQPTRDDLLESFFRRAEEYEKKKDFARAIQELREALKLKPNSAICHSRLGMIYLTAKQPKMAKIHFNKALELNPKDEIALAGKKSLEASGKAGTGTTAKKPASGSQPKANGKSSGKPQSGGGLFGLFGNKKK